MIEVQDNNSIMTQAISHDINGLRFAVDSCRSAVNEHLSDLDNVENLNKALYDSIESLGKAHRILSHEMNKNLTVKSTEDDIAMDYFTQIAQL